MVKINKIQSLIYKKCKSLVVVYDEVPSDNISFPCIVIGDIKVEKLKTKTECNLYNFQLNIFSTYSGKFETNNIVEKLENGLSSLEGSELDKNYYIDNISIEDCNIFKTEQCYQGIVNVAISTISL